MKNSADQGGCYPPRLKAAAGYDMVNYACGFNQSEKGKYFESIIILFIFP